MADFEVRGQQGALTVVARAGERMCLLAFNVAEPVAADFVGFAVEVLAPGGAWTPLSNRIAFDYGPTDAVNGFRNFPSLQAPFQTFRWIHFPWEPQLGAYGYRVTMMHWGAAGLVAGDAVTLQIELDPVIYPGGLDIGFTRNFASSQAFDDKYSAIATQLIPNPAKKGLTWPKPATDAYTWLGFEALQLLNQFLDDVIADPGLTLDVLAYDFNEPDILAKMKTIAARAGGLRAIIDNSSTHTGDGAAEDEVATEFTALGAGVVRTHFQRLQHNKVLIARRGGTPVKALCGSTNFSFRGLYIQANNMLVFSEPGVASLFGQMFDIAFADPSKLGANDFTKAWHVVTPAAGPTVSLCFSPHPGSSTVSLSPVAGAIDQASSSVLYSVAFLNMDKNGPVRQALDRLMGRPLFSYGVVDKASGLSVKKPDGSVALVPFSYLAKTAPEPFKTEWGGGAGITIHHKFVVTDFNKPTAKLFTGSSNLANGGEEQNGDHLIQIADNRVATAYAIEALRMFDHLHFRANMNALGAQAPTVIKLWKPGDPGPTWWAPFYVAGSQKAGDRMLFGT